LLSGVLPRVACRLLLSFAYNAGIFNSAMVS